jgi:Zn-finger nucleic acid-binding protein
MQICADGERQSAVLGIASTLATDLIGNVESNIRYVPCPVCSKLMNRVNFGNCSHVVVDVCAQHGTWFDRDELRRIVEFIRAGGLDKARLREMGDLEERRWKLNAARLSNARADAYSSPHDVDWGIGISDAAFSLTSFFD